MPGVIGSATGWSSIFYQCCWWFTLLYPIVAGLFAMNAALFFCLRWERQVPKRRRRGPPVSILVYARNHAAAIEQALVAARSQEYRDFEIIVIDDGSVDNTAARIAPFVQAGQVRLITKAISDGRAMALNDAVPCVNGEILVLLDADVRLAPGFLLEMVPHFETPRVAAVAANIQVGQPRTLIEQYQSLEYAAVMGLSGRAQRVIGRGYALPGGILACRKSALQDIGYFDPITASVEMDATWRLQMRSWDLRYEPRAVAWRQAASGLGELLLQHLDGTVSLLQMLDRHAGILFDRRYRRMWPLFAGACLSVLWLAVSWGTVMAAILSVLRSARWLAVPDLPGPLVMVVFTLIMMQAGLGLHMNRYEGLRRGSVWRYLVLYPVCYWLLHATAVVVALPAAGLIRLLRRPPLNDRPGGEAARTL